MKKILLLLLVGLLVQTQVVGQTVYQLPNPGFEDWPGTDITTEPTAWNSFPTAQCNVPNIAWVINVCSMGKIVNSLQLERSTDIRENASGQYSCKIKARDAGIQGVLEATANGTLTTGQIRVGVSDPVDSPENHNRTLASNGADLKQIWHGMPDSIRFWAKFTCPSATQEARMHAIIHDNHDYTDPENSTAHANYVVAKALCQFTKGDEKWHQYSVAFDYNYPATTPAFLLLTFTTNAIAGSGSGNDHLYIDDVEFVYNTHLTDLMVGGVSIPGFQQDKLEYTHYLCSGVAYPNITTLTGFTRVTAEISQASEFNGGEATITVKHSGWHPDSSRVYTVNFVHIDKPATQPVAAICGTGEVLMSATPKAATARWYNAATEGTLLETGNSYAAIVTESTTFYVSSYDSDLDCESERVPLTVTVNPTPSTPSVVPFKHSGGTVDLPATPGSNGNQCRWYESAESTEILTTANTYTVYISENVSYFVSTYNTTTQCESERVELVISIDSNIAYPVISSQTLCEPTACVLAPSGNNSDITYIWSLGTTILDTANTYTTPVLYETTTYTVSSLSEITGIQSDPLKVTITVGQSSNDTLETVIACGEHIWNGTTYTEGQWISHTFQSKYGCDSTVSFELIINQPSPVILIYDTTCQGETYTENGFNLPMQMQAGTHTHNMGLTNEQGCDSTITLYLTVNRIYVSEITRIACDFCEWEGKTYTESVLDTVSYQTINGCDSIITLNLTINYSSLLTDYIVDLCQGEDYNENDFSLPIQTDTGTFVHYRNLKNSTDCDSIIRLTLTVHPVSVTHIRDTIKVGETYTANGFDIETTKTGAHRDTLYIASSFGCDSTVVLLLIVVPDVGVEQYAKNIMIELLPNPANDYAIIRTEKAIEKVEIINIDGKLLETQYLAGEQERRINLSSYAKGFYFVKVTTNEGVITKKLIIQ